MPYSPVPVSGTPVVGYGMSAPDGVYGKEYSHDFDFSTIGPVADPQQVIAWDGTGGTADAGDYSGKRPTWEVDQEVDAIANSRDALFDHTLRDAAHLVFSHDDVIAAYGVGGGGAGFPSLVPVPSAGPVFLSNGNMIGGAGELSVEESGAYGGASSQFLWASTPEINAMPEPIDVDGVELWGPEPGESNEPDDPVRGDADKYSLDVDFPSGVSVWNESGTPYVGWSSIVGAVETMLGPIPGSAFSLRDEHQGRQAINLDALMVSDTLENSDFFNQDIGEPSEELLDQNGDGILKVGLQGEERGDTLIFSIRQIVDPMDPDGYYATGSELFVLDSLGTVDFLKHGGHVWDHAFALSEFAVSGFEDQRFEFGVLDINAIEAIGEGVEEPSVGLPGDFNGDGKVDAGDYTVWRDNLGTADPLAGNGDETGGSFGLVDIDDYLLWKTNYGAMAMPSPLMTTTSVPEPSAAVLLLATIGGLVGRRRK